MQNNHHHRPSKRRYQQLQITRGLSFAVKLEQCYSKTFKEGVHKEREMLKIVTKLLCKPTRENRLLPQIIFSRYLSQLFFHLVGCWSVRREDTWKQGDLGLVFDTIHFSFNQISNETPWSKLFYITFWYMKTTVIPLLLSFREAASRERESANSAVFQLRAAKYNNQGMFPLQ